MNTKNENESTENDLVSYLEEKFGHLKPYWSQIALGVCAVILAAVAGAYFMQQAQAQEAAKWQDLMIAQQNYRNNLNNDSLTRVADQYPDDVPGLWALLYAADAEVRSGLFDFLTDRQAGHDKITKAQRYYQRILDSSAQKSTGLQRRATFGLAYANESNGQFEEAANLYEQLVEIENNPFAEPAARGLKRCQDPAMAKLYAKFDSYVSPTAEEAPGMGLPKRPDISFPEVGDLQPDSGGDFNSETEDENAGS